MEPESAHASRAGAVIVGAGSGRRLGGVEKAFLPVLGRPLMSYAAEAFERSPLVEVMALVVPAGSLERAERLVQHAGWRKVVAIVPGGVERAGSVRAGLRALPTCAWVLIHDAARPLVSERLIADGLAAARATGAAIAALPLRDTIKRVTTEGDVPAAGRICQTIDRSGLWAAQTPQVFRRELLERAFAHAGARAGQFTDDAALAEAAGIEVAVYAGSPENIKLTLPEDVALVEALLSARLRHGRPTEGVGGDAPPFSAEDHRAVESGAPWPTPSEPSRVEALGPPGPAAVRAGLGYDIHCLAPGRRLILGGVVIPYELGLLGHSDGDALAHAIIDALLGACGLPDIGRQFPPDDPRFRDADSLGLLREAVRRCAAAGWKPANVDATVVCERPRLAPFIREMQWHLAEALGIAPDQVSVKAKTNEGLDAIGRGEAIAAQAIMLVTRK